MKKIERETINFEQRLNNTKAEFDKVMTGKRPQEIDFSDKVQDTPIKSNQLDLTMSQREAELAAIMKQQTKTKMSNNGFRVIQIKSQLIVKLI